MLDDHDRRIEGEDGWHHHHPRVDVRDHNGVLSADALDAHRQVLEMAATIEILARDFENQQQELLHAYERIRELTSRDTGQSDDGAGAGMSPALSSRALDEAENGGRSRGGRCCSHLEELAEMQKQLLDVKDTALADALQQRNEYRVELERAEVLIRDLRSRSLDGDGARTGWRVHATVSNMAGYHASGVAMSSTQSLLASGYVSAAGSGGGAIEVPRNERFDHESTYQRKENDELFWRKQYKEAVRMRKKYGLVNPTVTAAGHLQSAGGASGVTAARPSLKIFSYPDNRRQKGIKDENVPFSRYIGISARQHEIIKEQHRMLA